MVLLPPALRATPLASAGGEVQKPVRHARKKVLDKGTHLVFNKHNLRKRKTAEAGVKPEAHPQRVPQS